jgi:hypothetical protein
VDELSTIPGAPQHDGDGLVGVMLHDKPASQGIEPARVRAKETARKLTRRSPPAGGLGRSMPFWM